MRAFKTVNDTYIEPISFTVPRRAETFQSDIYPPATGLKPAVSAREWLGGKSGIPAKIDLESVYDGNAPVEVAVDYKPPPVQLSSPPPSAKPAVRKEPEPVKAASPALRSPPTMKEQKASIEAMTSRFHDDDEEDDDDDETSSFEEISKPAQRGPPPSSAAGFKPSSPVRATPASDLKASYGVRSPQATYTSPPPAAAATPTPTTTATARAPAPAATPSAAASSSSADSSVLEQIKQLLVTQNEKIEKLALDVETLKRKVASGSGSQDQSERIRQLELELEAARS